MSLSCRGPQYSPLKPFALPFPQFSPFRLRVKFSEDFLLTVCILYLGPICLFLFIFLTFWPCGLCNLISLPETDPVTAAVQVPSLNHQMAREFLSYTKLSTRYCPSNTTIQCNSTFPNVPPKARSLSLNLASPSPLPVTSVIFPEYKSCLC